MIRGRPRLGSFTFCMGYYSNDRRVGIELRRVAGKRETGTAGLGPPVGRLLLVSLVASVLSFYLLV